MRLRDQGGRNGGREEDAREEHLGKRRIWSEGGDGIVDETALLKPERGATISAPSPRGSNERPTRS